VEIRKELVKAFSRVPNLHALEQKGYFFCKYYDNASVQFEKGLFGSLGRNHKKYDNPKQENDESNMITVNNSKPKAQFEVFIRKIPFSSLHGIQFNKISGDAYKYKKVCDQVLSMASL
jgi:hypothetical protein